MSCISIQMDFYECKYGKKTAAWMSGAELRQAGASSVRNLLSYLGDQKKLLLCSLNI